MNKKLIGLILLGVLILFLSFLSFNKPLEKPVSQKIQVTTSIYPLHYFSSQIGGERVEVLNITPSGVEPHEYEPTSQEIIKIENSDLLILNGGIENWSEKIKNNIGVDSLSIINTGQGLGEGDSIDPHFWLDPNLAQKQIEKITEGLIKVDPENTDYYQTNSQTLKTRLDELDKLYIEGLKNCSRRDFITSHQAFGYLALAYNLNQVPISGLSPEEEPTSLGLVQIAKFARENNIKYIFFESLVSPKLSQTIASEVGAHTLVLDPLEGLSDDDKRNGKDYFVVSMDNLSQLKLALECK